MPQYLDHHPTIPDMPPEMVAFITQRLTSGQPDEFGEVGLHVFVGAQRSSHARTKLRARGMVRSYQLGGAIRSCWKA